MQNQTSNAKINKKGAEVGFTQSRYLAKMLLRNAVIYWCRKLTGAFPEAAVNQKLIEHHDLKVWFAYRVKGWVRYSVPASEVEHRFTRLKEAGFQVGPIQSFS